MPWTTKVTLAGKSGKKNLATVEAEFTEGDFKYATTKKGVEVDDASELDKFRTTLIGEMARARIDYERATATSTQLNLLLNS